MSSIRKEDFIEVLWAKIVIYSCIILMCLILVIIAPKKIFQDNLSFQLATSMAITENDNLILFDYDVYSTEERFNSGLIDDVKTVKQSFHERNEIVAIKIYGETHITEVREDYIFITSPETPELNIEYYLVKDLIIDDISIPGRTFIMLFNDFARLVNNIYLVILIITSFGLLAPFTIKLTRHIVQINRLKRANQSNKDQ